MNTIEKESYGSNESKNTLVTTPYITDGALGDPKVLIVQQHVQSQNPSLLAFSGFVIGVSTYKFESKDKKQIEGVKLLVTNGSFVLSASPSIAAEDTF